MTTIVWKPGYLAADRRISGDITFTGSKIKIIREYATAIGGDLSIALVLRHWFEQGADIEDFPDLPEDDDCYAELVVANAAGYVGTYSRSPHAEVFQMPFIAWGSGGAAAMGAMRKGATLVEAISVASLCDTGTGEGVELVRLDEVPMLSIIVPLLPAKADGTV